VGEREKVAQIMYIHVNNCKSDKIKFQKRKIISCQGTIG
jgi:hypothetical protein